MNVVDELNRLAPDGAYLLYRLIASGRRRASVALAVSALLFASVAGWSGVRYIELTAQVAATQDASLAHGLATTHPQAGCKLLFSGPEIPQSASRTRERAAFCGVDPGHSPRGIGR